MFIYGRDLNVADNDIALEALEVGQVVDSWFGMWVGNIDSWMVGYSEIFNSLVDNIVEEVVKETYPDEWFNLICLWLLM